MTEAFLQYVWRHQMLDRGLTTTDGQPVVVLRPGDLNHDAGPDFFNAHLKIGGIEWVGNIEVHIHTSDWKNHRHSDDAAYNNIILHVVYEHDCQITLQNGNTPLTLELKPYMHPSLVEHHDELMSPVETESIPCRRQLPEVPQLVRSSTLERLAMERIEGKSNIVRRMLDENHCDWEQTCYWLVAHYIGSKVNALPFELLAKSTDQRLLARWKDNPCRLEALLMGQAGLLNKYFKDDYPRKLQADYDALRSGADLTPIGGHLWKFYRIRPSSFPTIRISQFAQLVHHSSNLFATLLAISDVHEIEGLFDQEASAYWIDHYKFDVPANRPTHKRIGKMLTRSLIINAWIPLLHVYGTMRGEQAYKDQAIGLLMQLPPEDNVIVRRWQQAGITAVNAAETQALLQLDSNYCKKRRCLECRIGYHILKHK